MKKVTKQTFKIFWQHTVRYRWYFIVIILSLVIGNLFLIAIPLYYKKLFDVLSTNWGGDLSAALPILQKIILFILLLNFVEWVFWRVATFVNNYFQPRVMADIANTCFEYLHQHSFGFFVNRFVGSLVRKVNRLIHAFEYISDALFWNILGTTLRILSVLVIIFYYNKILGSIILVWVVLYVTINYSLTLKKLKYDEASAASDSRVTGYLSDSLTNNSNVKLFTAKDFEYQGFSGLTQEQFSLRKKSWDFDAKVETFQGGFMVILEFTIFWFAVKFWSQGLITAGTFVLIQAYLIQIFERLWDFGRLVRKIYQQLAEAEEMVEILNTTPQIQDKSGAKSLVVKKGGIEFRDVKFTYTDSREVISHFNIKVNPGEKVGLVGPSGAGKSTLVALILRFFDVTEGGIYIDGVNISSVTQESLRKNVSLVPQDTVLFHRTLMENILYGKREASINSAKQAAKLAHCDEFIQHLPQGYDTYVGERGIKLSGGERQRVAIARAMLKNAPILVLDEATSSLDSEAENLIQDALNNLMKGKTTIVIAHRLSTIMKMDRIVVIDKGRVQEIGSHQDLLQNSGGLYKRLWELQAGGFIG